MTIELTKEHMRLIKATVFKTLGRVAPDVADDMISETCLALLDGKSRGLHSYDPARGASLGTFICMVARSVALETVRHENHGRRIFQHDPQVDDDASDESGGGAPALVEALADPHAEDAIAMLTRKKHLGELAAALAKLPRDDQEFLENYLSSPGFDMVYAKKRGQQPTAARVRKLRLMEKLRQMVLTERD